MDGPGGGANIKDRSSKEDVLLKAKLNPIEWGKRRGRGRGESRAAKLKMTVLLLLSVYLFT